MSAVPINERALLTIDQAAHYIGVSPRTFRSMLAQGLFSKHKIYERQKLVRIKRTDLDAYVESLPVQTAGERAKNRVGIGL